VQMPISLMIQNGLRALKRKLLTRLLISSLANLLVMAISTSAFVPDDRRPSPVHRGPAGGETSEALADFMERVALSHVVGFRAAHAATSQEMIVAASETTTAPIVPFPPPRPTAVPQHDRPISSKVHVTASVQKALPPVQAPQAMTETAAMSAPVKREQPQYGVQLVSHLEDVLSASMRVVESVASAGDKLTSLAKNL